MDEGRVRPRPAREIFAGRYMCVYRVDYTHIYEAPNGLICAYVYVHVR